MALLKRSTVAEMPQTTGMPGTPRKPLISRCTMVPFSFSPVGLPMPRCASSSTRYSVSSGSSMVLRIVSQMVWHAGQGGFRGTVAPAFAPTPRIAPHQQTVLAQLLRVEEVDFPGSNLGRLKVFSTTTRSVCGIRSLASISGSAFARSATGRR
jgi:hypothetical protein